MAVRNDIDNMPQVERTDRQQARDRLEEGSLKVSRSIHSGVMRGGKPTRRIADMLHGTWLGHPLDRKSVV